MAKPLPESTSAGTRPWGRFALLILAVAQFVVVLDASIVNVSLPAIQRGLHFTAVNLSWVTNGYLLTFGGLLLFGGRIADVLGRRRVFVSGLIGFGGCSLACGLAQTSGELIAFRIAQGAVASLVAPAALALILVAFTEPDERSRAFGVYGAVSGAAGAAGVLFGGLLTQHAGWRWVFLVNVPITALVAIAAPRAVNESRSETKASLSQVDFPGAVLGTGGLALLVYAFIQTDRHSWGSNRTVGLLVAAAVILGVFVLVELRRRSPMLDPRLLTVRSSAVGNLIGLALGAGLLASGFYFLSLYFQQVLGYSAQTAGLAFLPLAVFSGVGSRVAGRLIQRMGGRLVTTSGCVLVAAGLGWLSALGVGQTFLLVVWPTVLVGVGLGLALVGVNDAATAGVSGRTAGQIGAIVTASQRVGGSLGLAVLASVAYHRTTSGAATHLSRAVAFAGGYDLAFRLAAIILAVSAVLALVGLDRGRAHSEQKFSPRPAEPQPPQPTGSARTRQND